MAFPKEALPGAQRCPKCYKMTLSFDPETRRMICSACGYEAKLRA
ncbi:MAG: hypothetical protein QW165_02325 [Candidatus Woesearchaeota archaeon]